ncbi:CTK3 domain-containing protein [Rhizoctonia solani AG-1 IA]|uniref:CTK3 domain-containing protein n=1 Tax=Thanatephorus cucumeris (strain AG1-IA) TaxID=983506 RepID=L8WKA7_THACA|nr:CTK3 domain-containing protein [Rhizoctonia solani AG-1 IA]
MPRDPCQTLFFSAPPPDSESLPASSTQQMPSKSDLAYSSPYGAPFALVLASPPILRGLTHSKNKSVPRDPTVVFDHDRHLCLTCVHSSISSAWLVPMDPFEVRMQFLGHLRKLNATQASIQKIVGYALKHYARCGEDLWDCVMEECQKGGVTTPSSQAPYIEYVTRDLEKIVEYVVPDSRDGLVNFQSARQILESWQTKRVLDPIAVSNVIEILEIKKSRKFQLHDPTPLRLKGMRYSNVLKKIAKEYHKLLRQRRWNVPTRVGQPYAPRLASAVPTARILPLNPVPTSPTSPIMSSHLASPIAPAHPLDSNTSAGTGQGGMPPPAPKHLPPRHALRKSYTEAQRERQRQRSRTGGEDAQETALDIEFEQAWETTSDWNEDDIDAVVEECGLCWGDERDIQTGSAEGFPKDSVVDYGSGGAYSGSRFSAPVGERS